MRVITGTDKESIPLRKGALQKYASATTRTRRTPAVWIAAVVVPFLDPQHLAVDLRDQRGIDPHQIRPTEQELVAQLFPQQRHQPMSSVREVPVILRQKPLPTRDMSIHKEAHSGDIRHAFAGLSQQHRRQDTPPKVAKMVRRKSGNTQFHVGDDRHGKKGSIGSPFFSSVLRESIYLLPIIYCNTFHHNPEKCKSIVINYIEHIYGKVTHLQL
jgi:hypothetical protein